MTSGAKPIGLLQGAQVVIAAASYPIIDPEILPFRPPKLAKSVRNVVGGPQIGFDPAPQYGEPFYPVRLLRARGERPCRSRAAEQGDEIATPHGAHPRPGITD